jgi:hypothetical protein
MVPATPALALDHERSDPAIASADGSLPDLRQQTLPARDGPQLPLHRQQRIGPTWERLRMTPISDDKPKTIQDRITDIYTWLREPDYTEEASIEWLIGWVERRPIAEVGMLGMLVPSNLPAALEGSVAVPADRSAIIEECARTAEGPIYKEKYRGGPGGNWWHEKQRGLDNEYGNGRHDAADAIRKLAITRQERAPGTEGEL